MKTLILYESQKGFTKECGEHILNLLEDTVLLDIKKDKYNLEEYDIVLVGAPIYEGKIDKTTVDFFKNNKWKLLDRKLAVFCAGMNTGEFNQTMQESLPGEIFLHAEIVHCGGRINFDTLNRKEKRVLKKRLGIKNSDFLDYFYKLDELAKWVNEIKNNNS